MADLSDIDRYVSVPTPDPVSRPSRDHPTGWEPGVDTAKGVVVTTPSEDGNPPQNWHEILAEFRLDPAKWEVDSDSVNVRTWDAAIGGGEIRRMFYFKADVKPRQDTNDADLESLMRRIGKHRYRRPEPSTDVASALVVCLSDWQAGPDPQGLVDHILNLKGAVVQLMKEQDPDALYVIGMGDMVEGCGNQHYPMQDWNVAAGGLNGRRDQVKLVRRLLVDLITEWARHVDRVVVGSVPGNHAENRRGGKAFTTFDDNDDLAVVEQVGEVLAANPDAYSHVRTVLPDGDMALVLDVAGTICAFAHGHQARKGATPQQKLLNWWKDKAHACHPVGDASVLCTGHFHHAQLHEDGPKTWMQCPALAQSRWWEEGGGPSTAIGTLTFTVGPDGWDNYRLLR